MFKKKYIHCPKTTAYNAFVPSQLIFKPLKGFQFSIFNVQLLCVLLCGTLRAQNAPTDSLEAVPLQETVISANRSGQSRTAVAQQLVVINRAQLTQMNAQTTADALQQSGAVFMQKSQQGGGSPVLRGFEASRVLLVVDGIRMNNAIYRAGHLQNVITIDNNVLDRMEMLFGPASTLYGSDALGGAVCFYTKNPTLAAKGQGFRTTGSALLRTGSVNNEKTGHLDFSLAGQYFGSLTSFTFSDFGDLRMGEKEGSAPFFGLRPLYAQRINGKDSLVRNADPYVQVFSGYRQYDALQKFLWKQSNNVSHTLNFQYSTSSDIPRYDRLTDPGANGQGLNQAEWYYGPQDRLLAAYTLDVKDFGWFNGGLRTTLNYQNIEESRHNRGFNSSNLGSRIETVDILGATADMRRLWGSQTLQMGVDVQYNKVASKAFRTNVNTAATSAFSTRYPDGGSNMTTIAAYASHQWQRNGWIFNEGVRAGWIGLKAKFDDKTFFPFSFDEATQSVPTISGNIGAVRQFSSGWRLALNAASGFRAPNVDDLARVFESQAGNRLIVPNPDITPEKTFNLDVNIAKSITDKLRWETVVWGTLFQDAIVVAPFQLNGQDSVLFDGKKSRVYANQNARKARLVGFSTALEADILPELAAYGSVAYTKGRIIADEGANTPLDHIPPVYGRLGVRWHKKVANAEAFVLFNGKKPIGDYNTEGEDNQQYAPADGMPAWWTLNLRGTYRLGLFSLQAGVENLLDVQYRNFASGINGPGRNLYAALRVTW